MSDSRAYVKNINPNSGGSDEQNSVHESSPAWVLTFVRWENRDTFRTEGTSPTQVREPLLVENDCVSVTTTSDKGTLTPSMSATLKMTDVNYETAVAPGDFVFVNMLNWPVEARRVANAARAKNPINGKHDGFKGLYKVQSVRRSLIIDPGTGIKIVVFKITGYAFTEFNNTIYFNQYLLDPGQDSQNQLLFASFLGNDWPKLVNSKGLTDVQNIVAVLIQSFIGTGIAEAQSAVYKPSVVSSKNVHFYIPSLVGNLLNVQGATAAKDIFFYLFGIQNYAGGSVTDLATGMNPTGLYEKFNGFFYTPKDCAGSSLLKPEYWNQVKAWSILNQYTNSPLNELYTCFRINPDGDVMPTVIFRQIPFTTEDFTSATDQHAVTPVTRFLTLPRWKISPALILEQDIGRDEAARINFVQYFGRSSLGIQGADIAAEIAQGNYLYDIEDVARSGLRPYVISTQFDDPTSVNKDYRSPLWAQIVGDALIGGHLKFNGSLTTIGIVDPITVGDNLELDGTVYHIEQISHTSSISLGDGKKTFRTTIQFSSGVSVSSSADGTRYSEMTYPNAYALRQRDAKNNKLLPGVSESQDTVYRTQNVDIDDNPNDMSANAPFAQPNTASGSKTYNGDDT